VEDRSPEVSWRRKKPEGVLSGGRGIVPVESTTKL
jgi:hypothetical protein